MGAEQAAEGGAAAAEPAPAVADASLRGAARVAMAARIVAVVCGALALALVGRYVVGYPGFDRSDGGVLIPPLLSLLGSLLALAVVVFRPERGTIAGLVATAITWSVVLLLALGVLWSLVDANAAGDTNIGTQVVSRAEADAYLSTAMADPAPDGAATNSARRWLVPTGVLLQAIEFSNANDVQASGYVWQTYPPDFPTDIPRGVSFPEAIAESSPSDPAYTVPLADGSQVLGWRFRVTLRQRFDYSLYPFDRQDVWLLLWAEDVQRRVVLVPDFAAYPTLDPATLPGLGDDFVDAGWVPIAASFSYGPNRDNATFGLPERATSFPQLYYNMVLKRSFMGPFLDHVVFAAVVSVLLFLILCLTAPDTATRTRFGISTFGVLGTCSGLLFAVILKDNQIRSTVSTGEIVYVEILPFLLYGSILLVAANALLLDAPIRLRLVDYRNNLLPDLLFWPLLLGALLVLTILVFFPPW